MNLVDKVALITGAGSGIGQAAAVRLAQEGTTIFATDIDDVGLEQTKALVDSLGRECLTQSLHVCSGGDWARCLLAISDRWGGLDILVAAAGISRAAPVAEMEFSEWHEVIQVNLSGVFLAVQVCIPMMRARGGGSIVIVSSASGIRAAPGAAAYASSKSALRGFAKSAAAELAADNIRVNTVFPGAVKTPMWKAMPFFQTIEKAEGEEAAWKSIATGTPLGRVATAEEIAEGILYLASSASSFVTGAELVMDGGYSA